MCEDHPELKKGLRVVGYSGSECGKEVGIVVGLHGLKLPLSERERERRNTPSRARSGQRRRNDENGLSS